MELDIKTHDGSYGKLNILVTGATGFIGTHLVRKLTTNHDHRISALVRAQSNISRIEGNNVNIVTCDIQDRHRLSEVAKNADIVLHLAAVKEHYESRESIMSTNVQGTKNLLDCSTNVKQFIFASSTLVSNPSDVYSESKKESERAIKESGINYTILRIAPVFGSGDATNLSRLIELIQQGKSIPIPGDGKQLIQPTHVDDVVKAFESAMMNGEFINRTCVIAGKPITLAEFIDSVSRILGKKPKGVHVPVGILRPMIKVYQKISDAPKITVEQLNNLGKTSSGDVVSSDFPTATLDVSIRKTCGV